MKKSILSIALCVLCAFSANADPSMPGLPGSGSGMTGGGSSSGPSVPPNPTIKPFRDTDRMDYKGENPVAPATLLLLGLAGGFAGLKIYNNTKKKNEEDYE